MILFFILKGGSDYIPISMVQLVFNSTVMSKCADINIRQDSLYEIDESFNAIISSDDVAAHFINNVSIITIQDNDSEQARLSPLTN